MTDFKVDIPDLLGRKPRKPIARSTKPPKRTRIRHKAKPSRTTKDGRTILASADYDKLKDAVYVRDGGMCQVCPELGRPAHWIPRSEATLDHKIPRGNGGGTRDDTLENTRLACGWSNNEKGSRRLKAVTNQAGKD